jgi:hypothetical protein
VIGLSPRRAAKVARRADPRELTGAGETLANPDYLDAFALDTDGDTRSAEQWARASFEAAPLAMRWFLLISWRLVLGLRLGPRDSREHVLGWRIVRVSPEAIVLDAESIVLGPAQLVFQVQRSRVLLGTFIRFERPGAALIWSLIGLIHRQTLPSLLTHTASRRKDTDG